MQLKRTIEFLNNFTCNFGGNIISWEGSYGQKSLELKISVGSDVNAFLQQASPIEQTFSHPFSLGIWFANCACSHSSVKVLKPSIIGR